MLFSDWSLNSEVIAILLPRSLNKVQILTNKPKKLFYKVCVGLSKENFWNDFWSPLGLTWGSWGPYLLIAIAEYNATGLQLLGAHVRTSPYQNCDGYIHPAFRNGCSPLWLMIHQHCFRQKKQENMLVFSHVQFKARENCHAFYMHNAHYCVRCCDASLLISHARAYVEVIHI